MAIQIISGRPIDDPSYARIGYSNKLLTASSVDYDAVLIPNTYERWELASGVRAASFQLSPVGLVNYVAIGAHNLFSSGVTNVLIELSLTVGSGYFAVWSGAPKKNSPIFKVFDDYQNIAEVKITITGGSDREIGVIYAGEVLIMQRALYSGHSPIALSSITEYRNATSDTGQFLGRRIKRKGLQASFAWANLTDEWYRENFQPFVISAKIAPFFMNWRPDYYSEESAFGYTTGDIAPSNQGGTTRMMGVSFTMRAHDE
tara:strand:+ start:83 stop:859 length:777 start_codon:yes stop_codon:yes gene_type:complete